MWEIQLFGPSLTLHHPDSSSSWSYSISYRDLPASSWLFGATRAALGFSCNDPGMGQAWSSHVFRAPSLSRIVWNMPSRSIKPPKTMCWICFNRFQHFVCLNMINMRLKQAPDGWLNSLLLPESNVRPVRLQKMSALTGCQAAEVHHARDVSKISKCPQDQTASPFVNWTAAVPKWTAKAPVGSWMLPRHRAWTASNEFTVGSTPKCVSVGYCTEDINQLWGSAPQWIGTSLRWKTNCQWFPLLSQFWYERSLSDSMPRGKLWQIYVNFRLGCTCILRVTLW
jgi:hypothetical protein